MFGCCDERLQFVIDGKRIATVNEHIHLGQIISSRFNDNDTSALKETH